MRMDSTTAATGITRQIATLAAVVAVVASSLVEIGVVGMERRFNPLLRVSEDFAWMAPLGLAAITLASCLAVVLVGWLARPRLRFRWVTYAACAIAIFNVLVLVPGLSHYAAAVLAAGMAVQVVRLIARHPESARRLLLGSRLILGWSFFFIVGLVHVSTAQPQRRNVSVRVVPPGPPNVLLITLDTVRAENLSVYGYRRDTTPALARFSRRGVVFDRAFATAPWTLPSHASLFTGRWPHELSTSASTPLDRAFPTLAEYLASSGYLTAGFAANLGYCSFESGLGRGFGHYEDYPRSLSQVVSNSTLLRTIANNFKVRRLIGNDQHLNRVSGADLNDRALRWLSRHGDSPFFMFMNYFDAHEPYLPAPPFDSRFGPARAHGRYSPLHRWLWEGSVGHRAMTADEIREEKDAYDGGLAYLDDHVGALLDELDRRHLLDNTLVVVTSDHGEELGEHGLFDHGYSLYRQALQVPLIVVKPDRVAAGRRVHAVVSLRDVPATILDLLGLSAGSPFPGESLAPLWSETGETRERVVVAEVDRVRGQPEWFPASKGAMSAIVHGGVHYIRNGDGTEELYDLVRDPAEHRDVAGLAAYAPTLAESRARLQDVLANGRLATDPARVAGRSVTARTSSGLPD
jgi:arylsulfatase A-like enzyme